MRVHELAKQLNVSSKEIIDKLTALGVDVKNHMSTVSDEAVGLFKLSVDPAAAAAAAAAAPAPSKDSAGRQIIVTRGAIIVKEFAEQLGMRSNNLIAELMAMNIFASLNERIDIGIAQKIAAKHGVTLEHEKKLAENRHTALPANTDEVIELDKPEDLRPRPPVVTILGHVDHGKTSLLDRIRNTMVAKGEVGGITQHIGAYVVEIRNKKITFLDTPGHEAFTAMRARGAHMTDIALLVVAANDGVMPQTKEAIQHAKAAKATIMVAINKSDHPSANPNMVKQQLQGQDLAPEEWGGTTLCVEVSALTGANIPALLDAILLQSEVMDLKANPARKARGYIVEARLEAGMGATATVLVKQGTLKVGDVVLCGQNWGRVKALIDDHGNKVQEAGPSIPVVCLGLDGVPQAGAEFRVYTNEKTARTLAEQEQQRARTERITAPKRVSLETMFAQLKSDEQLELKIVLKADVQGSIEAIRHALAGIQSQKVSLNIILAGVGNLTVNDVLLASASEAIVMGFNVASEKDVNAVAKREGVDIRLHNIIYELIDEVRNAMTGLLEPHYNEVVTGHALVQQVFPISKVGNIAGCMMTDGRVTPRSKVRVKRGDGVIYKGVLTTLKRFQNDVKEVVESQECGIRIDNFGDFKKGDVLEFYDLQTIAQTL